MIGIATQTFSATGAVLLKNTAGSDVFGLSRRVSRTPTLDGGCVVTDNGYSASDRTMTITATQVDQATREAVEALVKNYGVLVFSTAAGCFLGYVESCNYTDGTLTLIVLVTEEN